MRNRLHVTRIMGVATAVLLMAGTAFSQTKDIKVVGTGDGIDLLRVMADEFTKKNPTVRIEVPPSVGSGGGIAAVGAGKASLGRVARNLNDAEKASQIEYKAFANLPSAFYVNRSAGISGVTSDQIVQIFDGRLSSWKEVGGTDTRIRVVRRENEDSTLLALRAKMPGWKDLAITDKSKLAATTQEAIETVREVQGAIGFGPYSRGLPSDLVVLKIDGRMPDEQGYPSSVELALIHRHDISDADAKAFVAFSTSSSARAIIRNFGAVPTAAR